MLSMIQFSSSFSFRLNLENTYRKHVYAVNVDSSLFITLACSFFFVFTKYCGDVQDIFVEDLD